MESGHTTACGDGGKVDGYEVTIILSSIAGSGKSIPSQHAATIRIFAGANAAGQIHGGGCDTPVIPLTLIQVIQWSRRGAIPE